MHRTTKPHPRPDPETPGRTIIGASCTCGHPDDAHQDGDGAGYGQGECRQGTCNCPKFTFSEFMYRVDR